jgi:hypothetical protein
MTCTGIGPAPHTAVDAGDDMVGDRATGDGAIGGAVAGDGVAGDGVAGGAVAGGAVAVAAAAGPAAGLDPRSERILVFELRWWRHAGAKEQAIRDTFGLSPTRYYQLLNRLLDQPAALAHDPVLVSRLRRLRASRTRSRLP